LVKGKGKEKIKGRNKGKKKKEKIKERTNKKKKTGLKRLDKVTRPSVFTGVLSNRDRVCLGLRPGGLIGGAQENKKSHPGLTGLCAGGLQWC